MEEALVGPRNLDSRVKLRWFAGWAVFLLPLIFVIFLLAYVVLPDYGFTFAVHYEALLIFFTIIIVASLLLSDELRYRRYLYYLRPGELIIEKGIIEKIRYIIPYEKIQNVRVSRDLLDRMLGLCTLHIETATHAGSENLMVLPGIPESMELEKQIRTLSKSARESTPRREESEKEILQAILKELSGIRRSLEKPQEAGPMVERLRKRG